MSCRGAGLQFLCFDDLFFSPRTESTKSKVARIGHWLFFVHKLVKISLARPQPIFQQQNQQSLLVVSCKFGEKSSNRLLDSSFTLFFSVSADGPLQCGHPLPFCFSTTEATNLCIPRDTPGAQTSLAQRASCLKNKRNWLSTFKNRRVAHKNPDCQLLNKRERKRRLAASLGLHTCCLLSGLRRTGAVFSKWDKPVQCCRDHCLSSNASPGSHRRFTCLDPFFNLWSSLPS